MFSTLCLFEQQHKLYGRNKCADFHSTVTSGGQPQTPLKRCFSVVISYTCETCPRDNLLFRLSVVFIVFPNMTCIEKRLSFRHFFPYLRRYRIYIMFSIRFVRKYFCHSRFISQLSLIR